jgi:hypothetical protein
MKLSKERIAHMAESLVQRLTQQKVVAPAGSHQAMVETLGHAITEELAVEDKLNADEEIGSRNRPGAGRLPENVPPGEKAVGQGPRSDSVKESCQLSAFSKSRGHF